MDNSNHLQKLFIQMKGLYDILSSDQPLGKNSEDLQPVVSYHVTFLASVIISNPGSCPCVHYTVTIAVLLACSLHKKHAIKFICLLCQHS